MIVNFADKTTEAIFHGANTKAARKLPVRLHAVAQRKLYYLDAAGHLLDLRQPPGNMLQKLYGDLDGFHSIRINDQWRIVFRWLDNNAEDVRIADYH